MKNYFKAILIFFIYYSSYAQDFYIVSQRDLPSIINKTFKMNLQDCDSINTYTCPPTVDILNAPECQFTDIAVNKTGIYYVTGGSGILYRRNIADSTSCLHLGTFNYSINALVADTLGNIYATGQQNGICKLFKYNSGIFTTLGTLPNNFFSCGDLFFYMNRLFMTGTTSIFTGSYLVEVDIANPSQSCYYMGLQNLQPWGAFSVYDGVNSRAFIIGTSTTSVKTSSLIEINMQAKTIGIVQCVYPFLVGGAGVNYEYSTAGSSICNLTSLSNQFSNISFFKVNNPVGDYMTFQTNIDLSNISSIELFDVSGKKIKSFKGSEISEKININDLTSGVYILNTRTTEGVQYQQKIIK
ncbi:MAG: T9SS type A sorting domain-containing protein [Bacteroidetes bacterium]|nr:T9SS type A sorting domain-containing protein [Bacteroidota bacterium]